METIEVEKRAQKLKGQRSRGFYDAGGQGDTHCSDAHCPGRKTHCSAEQLTQSPGMEAPHHFPTPCPVHLSHLTIPELNPFTINQSFSK